MDFSSSSLSEFHLLVRKVCFFFSYGNKSRSSADINQPTSTEVRLGAPVHMCLNNKLFTSDGIHSAGQDFPISQVNFLGLKFIIYR